MVEKKTHWRKDNGKEANDSTRIFTEFMQQAK